MQTPLNIPESLQAQFLSTCAQENIDGQETIKALLEEFLADVALTKELKHRMDDEDGRSLDQIIEDHGLDI